MDDELVTEYLEARTKRDAAQEELDEATERLVKQMEADQRKSYRWSDEHRSHTLTYTQARATEIDEKGLRRALTAKVFDRYTKRVLDRRAMEAAMDAGKVDPVTVGRFVSFKPGKPHLTYREKEVTE